jgi:hypothetical protein
MSAFPAAAKAVRARVHYNGSMKDVFIIPAEDAPQAWNDGDNATTVQSQRYGLIEYGHPPPPDTPTPQSQVHHILEAQLSQHQLEFGLSSDPTTSSFYPACTAAASQQPPGGSSPTRVIQSSLRSSERQSSSAATWDDAYASQSHAHTPQAFPDSHSRSKENAPSPSPDYNAFGQRYTTMREKLEQETREWEQQLKQEHQERLDQHRQQLRQQKQQFDQRLLQQKLEWEQERLQQKQEFQREQQELRQLLDEIGAADRFLPEFDQPQQPEQQSPAADFNHNCNNHNPLSPSPYDNTSAPLQHEQEFEQQVHHQQQEFELRLRQQEQKSAQQRKAFEQEFQQLLDKIATCFGLPPQFDQPQQQEQQSPAADFNSTRHHNNTNCNNHDPLSPSPDDNTSAPLQQEQEFEQQFHQQEQRDFEQECQYFLDQIDACFDLLPRPDQPQ